MTKTNRVVLGFIMVIAGAALLDLNVHMSGIAVMILGIVLIVSYIEP